MVLDGRLCSVVLNLVSFLSMRKFYRANIELSKSEGEFVTMLYEALNQEDV
jgi:hypothetical protein